MAQQHIQDYVASIFAVQKLHSEADGTVVYKLFDKKTKQRVGDFILASNAIGVSTRKFALISDLLNRYGQILGKTEVEVLKKSQTEVLTMWFNA